jgi:hypothetical protein
MGLCPSPFPAIGAPAVSRRGQSLAMAALTAQERIVP